jgi:hypothetical protein
MITQPGEYSLGTNVGPCDPLTDGIDILASNVTLHLNGHTIAGSCDSSAIGIHVGVAMSPTALTQVRVLGTGTIIGFTNGFVADNSAGSFVKFVTVIPTCSSNFSFGFDIHAPSSQWKLEGNVVLEEANNRNNSAGIVLGRSASGVNDCDVVRNTVNDTISVHGDNHIIVNNTANDNVGGLFVTGNNNEIHANTTDNNTGSPGILLALGASGNFISGNTSLKNTPFDMEDDNTPTVTTTNGKVISSTPPTSRASTKGIRSASQYLPLSWKQRERHWRGGGGSENPKVVSERLKKFLKAL